MVRKKKNTAAAPPGRLKATLLANDAVWLVVWRVNFDEF